jgi:hypothetical protein
MRSSLLRPCHPATSASPAEQTIEDQQPHPHADRRVGKVEDKGMPFSEVKVEKINYGASHQPVERIAGGTPDNKSDRDRQKSGFDPEQPRDKAEDDDRGDRDQDQSALGPVVEHPEANTPVHCQDQIEKASHAEMTRRLRMSDKKIENAKFRELIEDNDHYSDRDPPDDHHAGS